MLNCKEALEKISSLSGLDLDESIDLSIEQGREYQAINYISGYIKGLDTSSTSSAYEVGVYTKECSISTGQWVYKDKLSNTTDWCLSDCYLPYESICQTKEPTYIDKIYEPDVYEPEVYQKDLIYKESFKPCGWDSTSSPYIPPLDITNSIYEISNSILNKYTLDKGLVSIEPFDSCYENCYTQETIEIDKSYSFVVNNSTCYEEGVFDNCYVSNYFVYWQTPMVYEESCYDSCTTSLLFPLFIFSRRNNEWHLEENLCADISKPTRYIDNDGHLIKVEVSSCIEREPLIWGDDLYIDQDWLEQEGNSCLDNCYEKRYYYYDHDRYVYQEGVYESGVYTRRALLMTLPFLELECPSCNVTIDCLVSFLGNIVLKHHYELEVRNETRVQEFLYSKARPREILDNCCTKPFNLNGELLRINGDSIEIFQEGITKDQYVYSLDIGYTVENTNEFIPIQTGVPITLNGFYSLSSYIPEGIKTLILYKSSYYIKKEVARLYGNSSSNRFLIQDTLDNFSSITNRVTIEDLSISLILLLLSKYKELNSCSNSISTPTLDPYIRRVITNNLDILSELIDSSNGVRQGSIPKEIRTNTKAEHIYQDSYYLDKRVIKCYEDTVYANKCDYLWDQSLIIGDSLYCLPSCYEDTVIDLSVNREVDNRAIAWLLLAFLTYTEVINDNRYQESIDSIYTYLKNEIDFTSKFIHKGYTHSSIYSESRRIETLDTSTNIAVCIALLKYYSVTSDSIALLYASKLKRYIYDYLYSRQDELFMDEGYFTLDSNLYGLWLSLEVNEAPAVENILEFFRTSLDRVSTFSNVKIETLDNEDITLMDSSYIFTPIETLSIRNNTKVNNLLFYLFVYAIDQGYTPSFFISKDISLFSNIGIASCLSDSFFENELFRTYSYEDLEVLETSESLINNRLVDMMPTGFGWFSPEALTKQGNIGNLLSSVSGSLALNKVNEKRIRDSIALTTSRTFDIKRWEQDLNLPRWVSESYSSYKERIRRYIDRPYIVKQAISYLLDLYGIRVIGQSDFTINTTNKYSSSFISTYSAYQYETDFFPNRYITVIDYPLTTSLYKDIKDVSPIGVELIFDWRLDIESCSVEEKAAKETIVDTSYVQRIPSYTLEPVCCSDKSCRTLMKITLEFSVPYPLYLSNDEISLTEGINNLCIIRANNPYSYYYL